MSVDSLDRQWEFINTEHGYLIAKSKDGKAALFGRMCERDDGKFCIEIVVRAEIQNNRLCQPEFFHAHQGDNARHAQQLAHGLRGEQIEQRTFSEPRCG